MANNIVTESFHKKMRSKSVVRVDFKNSKNQSIISTMTRLKICQAELDALLKANKAEVAAVAASMREDLSKWRGEQNIQIANLNSALSGLISKIDSKFEVIDTKINSTNTNLNAKFDGIEKSLNAKIDAVSISVNGKVDGINTAIAGVQSGISTKLVIFSVVLAIMLSIAGWIISYPSAQHQFQQPMQKVVVPPKFQEPNSK
ncbi:MAG: hypothetical protein ACL7AY_08995 [Candidatus Arsenophonus phytopathogenicus]